MHEGNAKFRPVHENLDTAYVNLAALVRYLQQREFGGRVHVMLIEYEADIFLRAGEQPRVQETNHTTGRSAEGEAALQRLFVRASEPGGLVSVYEGSREELMSDEVAKASSDEAAQAETKSRNVSPEEGDWPDLVRLSGELIATVERSALSAGADFNAHFRAVRLMLADWHGAL
jgi:hypothetical protein